LVTVVQEMGRLTQTPTPALDAVLALVAQRAKIAGLYGDDRRPMQAKSPVFCMIALPWPLRCPVDICRARRHPDFENSKQHGTRAVAPRRGKVRGPA
jgi:hypothetical protein